MALVSAPLLSHPLSNNNNKRNLVFLSCNCKQRISCSLQAPDLAKLLGQAVWGASIPPSILVGAVRNAWTGAWAIMMKQLAPSDPNGSYERPDSRFRSRPPRHAASLDSGRYHLYASLTCPWAHRALIVHALKGLQAAIPVSIAVPSPSGLWEFNLNPNPNPNPSRGHGTLSPTYDKANRCRFLKDVYKLGRGGYNGRATVPMLWDSQAKEVVNNESADIIEILNSDFNHLALNPELDLAPPHLLPQIENWNGIIYPNINNGVYRCGFSQGQAAYDSAVKAVFPTLDILEEHLSSHRYICGDHFTLADVRLFTTLFRFDPVYNILFKCCKHKLAEYSNLYSYMRDIYQIPGVATTCDLEAVMDGYYKVLFPLNPGGITPVLPHECERESLMKPHNCEHISATFQSLNAVTNSL